MKIGDKVKVFDHRLYINDIVTPLSVTIKEAIILCFRKDNENRDVIDVKFDYDNRESRSHFIWTIDKP